MFDSVQNNTWLFFRLLLFEFLFFMNRLSRRWPNAFAFMSYSLKNFKDLHMFFKELACFILFSYQCSCCLLLFFLCLCFATTHLEYHIFQTLSTTFFKIFKKVFFKNFNAERGIWTLAPVARPTPLAGAPLQPLEYFCWTLWFYITLISQCNGYYKWEFSFCQSLFLKIF